MDGLMIAGSTSQGGISICSRLFVPVNSSVFVHSFPVKSICSRSRSFLTQHPVTQPVNQRVNSLKPITILIFDYYIPSLDNEYHTTRYLTLLDLTS